MAYVKPLLPGKSYGLGTASAAVNAGYPAKVSGNDTFANGDATSATAGVIAKNAASGEGVAIFMDGGVYETDVFESGVAAGDPLKVGSTGKLAKNTTPESTPIVGQALSVSSGVMVYKLFV